MIKHILRSIWFWWIMTTLIYLAFNFNGYPVEVARFVDLNSYIAAFIGLFVPYGLAAGMLLIFSPMSWLSAIVFFFLMFLTEKKLKRWNLSLGKKILFNLLALLIITTIIDFVRFTPLASWNILLSGSIHTGF